MKSNKKIQQPQYTSSTSFTAQFTEIACLETVFIAPSKGITAGSILNAAHEIFNEFTRLQPVVLSFVVFVHKTNAYMLTNGRRELANVWENPPTAYCICPCPNENFTLLWKLN